MTLEITMIVLFVSLLASLILSVCIRSTYQDIEQLKDSKPEEDFKSEEVPSVSVEAPVEEEEIPVQAKSPQKKTAIVKKAVKKDVKKVVKKAPKRRPRRD
jgi:hypothetical protein